MENHDPVNEYALQHTSREDDVLHQIYRETNLTTVYPHMLSGHLQGKLLEMISKMIRPEKILEIGTFTGYSAICMAKGLAEGGLLHTIDINDELADVACRYFVLAGLVDRIRMHTGHACEIIPTLEETFDLVFIDADKEEYLRYYELSFPKVRIGGFILADNVLWGGKVLPSSTDKNKETRGVREFNEFVMKDNRVEKLFLPFRDGLYMLRKISD